MGYVDDKRKYEYELKILEEDLIFTENVNVSTPTQVAKKREEMHRLKSEIERVKYEIHYLDKFCIGYGIKYYPKGTKLEDIQ